MLLDVVRNNSIGDETNVSIYIYVSIYMYPVSCLLFRNILDNARIASSTETVMIGQSGHACLTSHCHVSRCDGASFSH